MSVKQPSKDGKMPARKHHCDSGRSVAATATSRLLLAFFWQPNPKERALTLVLSINSNNALLLKLISVCNYIRYQYRFYLRSVKYELNILYINKFLKYCHFLEVMLIGSYRLNCKCVQNLGQITRPNKQINIFCLKYLLLIFCVLN